MKIWKMLAVSALTLGVLGSCGSKSSTSSSEKKTIKISVIEAYVPYFTEASKEFTTANPNITVEVTKVDDMFKQVTDLATQKANADDLMLVVHDRIGDLVDKALLAPVDSKLEGYDPKAVEAASYNGKNYLLPLSGESVILIYNKDKVTTPAKTLSEIPAKELGANFTDFYMESGLMFGKGGYVFGKNNTDVTDVGVANEGSIKAGEIVKSLYKSGSDTWTLMQDSATAYATMNQAFIDGKINYMINGPWSFADLTKAKVNFGTTVIPGWDAGEKFSPMTGTKGVVVNAYSKNIKEANMFIDFLATEENAQKWADASKEISPFTKVMDANKDANAISIIEGYRNGTPMPKMAAMASVWTPMADALKQIATGSDVKAALDAAKKQVDEATKK